MLALLLLFPTLALSGCPGGQTKNEMNTNATQPSPAASPAPTAAIAVNNSFDGQRAFEHVRKQVEIGPRPAGSAELARARDYITSELKSYGVNVSFDEWTTKTPMGNRKMVNVIAEIPGESSDVILLTSHYDSKYVKDFRFVGANDGGSSTGILLELARDLAASHQKPPFTYRFVFFDGEEAFCFDWDECRKPDLIDNTYGSRHYADLLKQRNELKRLRAMILLDMVGYKDLQIPREEMSSSWLVDIIWKTAADLGHGKQFINEKEGVDDDHTPFLKMGVDAADLIQLSSYPYWHKAEDTLDKVSAESLKTVGDVVLNSLPRIEQKLATKR